MDGAGDPLTSSGGPVFIGGPHRSGTGMLRAVLGSNSQLALPPKEYQFFDTSPIVDNGDWATNPEATLAAILTWPKVREWGLAEVEPSVLLADSDGSAAAIYAAPLRAFADIRGKPRFGEKTPYLEDHFPILLEWFGPSLRFVHMVRRPIPTFVSLAHQYGARAMLDPVLFARRWRSSVLRGRDLARRYPEQYLMIDYEAFTADPRGWTERLCAFCDLPPEIDRMLEMTDFQRKMNSSFEMPSDGAPRGTIVEGAATRHPRISPIDAWFIERELGTLGRDLSQAADVRERPWLARVSKHLTRIRARFSA